MPSARCHTSINGHKINPKKYIKKKTSRKVIVFFLVLYIKHQTVPTKIKGAIILIIELNIEFSAIEITDILGMKN